MNFDFYNIFSFLTEKLGNAIIITVILSVVFLDNDKRIKFSIALEHSEWIFLYSPFFYVSHIEAIASLLLTVSKMPSPIKE